MFKEILISIDEMENRIAVLEDGKLMEIFIAREEHQIGSIYKGKVANVLPGMQAAFVDIGLERNAFLCVDDAISGIHIDVEVQKARSLSIKDILKVNQETLVQIVKESIGTKGARVTTFITLPGRFLVLIPTANYTGISRRIEDEGERNRLRSLVEKIKPKSYGLIVRTAAEGKDRESLEKDLQLLIKMWKKIQNTESKKSAPAIIHSELTLVYKIIRDVFTQDVDRLIIDSHVEYDKILELMDIIAPHLKGRIHLYLEGNPLFQAYGVESEIDKSLRRKVWLESGGYIIIDKTEALTSIDVNTGKYIGRTSLSDTILRTNLEAVDEITRQVRLRDIGGILILDFIDMERMEDRGKLMRALHEALKRDRTKTHIVGLTELGLIQITRKRVNRDLDELLRTQCPYCGGKGRVLSVDTICIKAKREIKNVSEDSKVEAMLLRVNPRIGMKLLGWEGEDLEQLEEAMGKPIYLRVNPRMHVERIDIETATSKKYIEEKISDLSPGEELDITVEEVFGLNLQNGMCMHKGNLIEVLQAGNRIGKKIKVVVTLVSRSYSQAQIKE
ncbi:MAG: Rne/Rng family ribonuclease [Candidatus Eremiobacteraeota bacterium]|nr:Rne/Rng family ribonuclease [Candidatus Eremiobacteraeota bacterium]